MAWSVPGSGSPRLHAAIAELVAAIMEEVRSVPVHETSTRLLSMTEAADALGVGRASLYQLFGTDGLRSIKVGRRRLVPATAIQEFIQRQGG